MLSLKGVLIACLILMTACGGGGSGNGAQTSSSPQNVSPAPSVSGNWNFSAISVVAVGPPFQIIGSLTSSGSSVTGTLESVDSNGNISSPIAMSGTITAGNLLSASSPPGPTVLSISATVSGDGKTMTSGSYSSTGIGSDHGTFTGFMVPSFAGTWTFSTSVAPVMFQTTIVQSAASDGSFSLTGTVTVANSACFPTNTQSSVSGSVVGATLNLKVITGDAINGSTIGDVIYSGVVDQVGKTVSGQFRANSSLNGQPVTCDGVTGSAVMTRN